MSDSYTPITIYPEQGDKFVECVRCKNPCVVGIEEERNTCLMCLMFEGEDS
jgi:hypothetical protein